MATDDRDAEVRLEPCPRRVRAVRGGAVVIDSERAQYGYPKEGIPVPSFWVPVEDVAMQVLEEQGARDVVWNGIEGHVTFSFDDFDAVFEEAEQVFVHPRDPKHRVDVVLSDRRVQVFAGAVKLADSDRAMFLFEEGLPARYYLPKTDVRMDLLEPSETTTRCPYKGTATYVSARAEGQTHEDVAWSYEAPRHDALKVAGMVCFDASKVEVRLEPDTDPPQPEAVFR